LYNCSDSTSLPSCLLVEMRVPHISEDAIQGNPQSVTAPGVLAGAGERLNG